MIKMQIPAGYENVPSLRDRFYLPEGLIYLDGNSLGLLSRDAEEALFATLKQWKLYGVEGWTAGESPWFTLAEDLARLTAPLVGAEPEEVIVTNSTTVNLHQLLATLYIPDPVRPRILTDSLSFPSDLYALQSHLTLRGRDPERDLVLVSPPPGSDILDEQEIVARMEADVQMVLLPGVVYTTGQALDTRYLTQEAHARGILIGFDCSHSIGAVPHHFDEEGVDFAFWCNYKYLNGGPGATGGLYLNRRHFDKMPGLAGWFGSAKPRQFDMSSTLVPAPHAGALQIGTPNILSMAPLKGALNLLHMAGLEALRARSLALTGFLFERIDAELVPLGVQIVTPREPGRRGGHVAIRHPEAMRLCKALRNVGVVPDHRPPDIIRFAPAPLYNTFTECEHAIQQLKEILLSGSYLSISTHRDIVP